MELPLNIKEFVKNCSSCKRCQRVCPFLDTYGMPNEIITEKPEKVFFCSNCKACDTVCTEKLLPSDALFEMKSILMRNGPIPEEVRNVKQSASGFAMRGHKFPFSYYPSTDTVFWPGCGLAGTSPEIVKKTVGLLSEHLNKKVGVVLDCCFDPLYQLGDIDSVKKASKRILDRLQRHKVTHVITGCTNCRKTLFLHLPEIKVEHIIEALPENFINPSLINDPSTPPFISPLSKWGNKGGKGDGGGLFLHHPCPSFRLNGIRERAKAYVQSLGNGSQFIKDNENTDSPVNEIKESLRPSCCGKGGELVHYRAIYQKNLLKES